ncbi:MAG: DUF4423 domain-containing protein [Bdellovibrionaceae bacterium]|nr:DUF4423 domain-containing protein [Pseudobdellovibrionaceae bacterium]
MENQINKNKQSTPLAKTDKKPEIIDFRLFLQEEFLRRLKMNPQYSVRAYAQFFKMNSGSLSQILRGKRALGKSSIEKMAQQLNLSPDIVQQIIESHENKTKPTEPQHKAQKLEQLTMDTFTVISDWYHFAILELPKLKGFQGDSHWIAKKLSLNVTEVNAAIERLIRVNALEIDLGGVWTVKNTNLSTLSNDFSTVALRKLQTQILGQATDALANIPMEQRSQSSLTVGINKEDLETVKSMIHRFRRELNAFVESNEEKDDIYQVSLSLFPITK